MRWTLLATLLVIFGTPAQAQQESNTTEQGGERPVSDTAAEAFWQGKAHYDAGEMPEAVEQFKRAYRMTRDPDLLYNIAQAYRKAGDCSSALANYRDFLRAAPDSPLATQAEAKVQALQATCGSEAESTPLATNTKPGVVDTAPAVAPAAASAPGPTQLEPMPQAPTVDEPPRGALARTWSLIALSGAAVAGGIALGLELWNLDRHHEWETRDQDLAKGNAPGETDAAWAVRQGANDDLGHSIERVGRDVTYVSIGAGALLATGAILYLWNPTSSAPKAPIVAPAVRAASVRSVSLVPGRGGLAITGCF